jgi:hypothetical protein
MKQIASLVLVKRNGKLTPKNKLHEEQYKLFTSNIPEGKEVTALFELVDDTNTKAQLAKVHVMIKEIAEQQGQSAAETKLEVKDQCNLTYYEDGVKKYKSFGKASKEDLSYVIEVLYQLGEFFNINFRENFQ